jgi:hypothetical protein
VVKQFEGTVLLPGDPVNFYVRGERMPGWLRIYPNADEFINDEIDRYNKEVFVV